MCPTETPFCSHPWHPDSSHQPVPFNHLSASVVLPGDTEAGKLLVPVNCYLPDDWQEAPQLLPLDGITPALAFLIIPPLDLFM